MFNRKLSDMRCLTWVAAAVGVGTAAYSIGEGIHKKNMAKKALAAANAERPMEQVPQAVLNSQALAQQNANTGLPSAQYNAAMQNIKNQQMQALSGSADRRGGLALLGQIQSQGNNANLQLDSANSAQRLKNDQTLVDVNSEVGQYQDKAWQNNYNDKYKNDYNYAMGLLGSGNANVTTGVDQLGASGTRVSSGSQMSSFNNGKGIFGNGSGGSNGGSGAYNWGANSGGGDYSQQDPNMYAGS
jgi:hypothetical protein